MIFKYTALAKGQPIKGKISASTEKEVVEFLRNNNLFPVSVEKETELQFNYLARFFDRVSFGDIIDFTRQFALMLNAGLTLSSSFDIIVQQTKKKSMYQLITNLSDDIRSGENLSKSIAKYSNVFPRIYIALVKAGEASGKLNEILLRLADDLDKQREYNAKIRGSLTYPAIVIIGIIGVVFILLTVVVPQLTTLYDDLQIELPMTTQIVMKLSDFAVRFWYLAILAVGGLVFGFRKFLSDAGRRYSFFVLLMKIPVLGDIMRISSLVDATRTLSILISSGVLVLESLNIVEDTSNNVVFQRAFENVYKSVQGGMTISQAFEKEAQFPPILVQMTAVGERTGKLDEMLGKISKYFEVQSDLTVKTATTLIEPLTLVMLGGIVFFIVMAVISPIYNITSSMSQ